MIKIYNIIIIGAGASGLFYSCNSPVSGLILDAGATPGRKLMISGGGKCNFSNHHISTANYICQPDDSFCGPALSLFSADKILELLKKWRLPYEERENGRLFLKCSASLLRERLIKEAIYRNNEIKTNCAVKKIMPENNNFAVFTNCGKFLAKKVVLATGSMARPKLAICKNCWSLAGNLGHTIYAPVPALTPLVKLQGWEFSHLTGIGLPVKASVYNSGDLSSPVFSDNLLFTHNGLSGPAILQASLYWFPGCELHVDFLPDVDFEKLLDANEKRLPTNILNRYLPQRLVMTLLPGAFKNRKSAEISRKDRRHISLAVHRHIFTNLETAGFSSAEIARGGVSTEEINPYTMQSRLFANLQILGEMQAVSGQLGGYNIHWAFASAWCAANSTS